MAYLRCFDPVRKTSEDIMLRKPLVTIGRATGNDVVLTDPSIAPTHANLVRRGGQHQLSVVQRTNELYVNGRLTRSATLKDRNRPPWSIAGMTMDATIPPSGSASSF